MIRNVLNKLGTLRSALAVGVAIPFLIGGVASAQEIRAGAQDVPNAPTAPALNPGPTPASGQEATTERVVVTGSYIPTAETESALPVTVYTAAVLQKQGAQTPVEGLRQLPSFVGNAATENDSNGGNGSATINLRAIGTQNTLVLLNGRRAFLGTGNNGGADINAIGVGPLSRTEILKDGASAIYGSDAVAGVVNFILLNGPGETPYEGAEIFTLYGNTTDTDAHVRQVYVRGGVATDKVSIAAAGEYYSRANLFSRDRAAVAGTGNLGNDPTGLGLGGLNNNSPTFAGRVSTFNNSGPVGTVNAGPGLTGAQVLIDPNNNAPTPASYRRFDVPAGTDPSRFNFRAFTPAIPAQEKALYYVTGRYKVFGEALQIAGDVLFTHQTQDNGLAPAPFSFSNASNGLNDARASIFNPFPNNRPKTTTGSNPNPTGNNLSQLRYRLVNELGNRKSFFEQDYYRYVGSINGDFNFKDNGFISHFGYDSGFVYERYDELRTDSGDATRTGIRKQIVAGNFNPFIGQNAPVRGNAPTYVNGVQTGTAPYDNFAAVNQQGVSFIGQSQFFERDWLVDAKFNAHLFPNLYNGGIDLAAGYEHRQIRLQSVPDNVEAAGDQLGFNAAPNLKNIQDVDSFFGELSIPIISSTMNIPFARSLELAVAYRYEKFKDKDQYTKREASFNNRNPDEDFGGTPRFSLRYQPISDLTLRASFGQSFRSPTPNGLFNPVAQNFPQLFDPLKGNTLQPPDGVFQGGSLLLTPEKTDSYTAGFVYTPKFLKGLTVTADYYQLFTTDLILDAASFAQLQLTQNGNSAKANNGVPTVFVDPDGSGGGSRFGGSTGGPLPGVTRDPLTGDVQSIDSLNANAGRRNVQGLDVTVVYQLPTERFGEFTFSLGYNHFFVYKVEAIAGGGYTNFLGNYNNGSLPLAPGAIPFNKGFLRGEYQFKGFDFVATMNYIGDYEDDPAFIKGRGGVTQDLVPGNIGTDANPNYILHRRVTQYITLDMRLSYEFKKPEMQAAAAAAGYSKDAKDAKSAMSTAAVAGADNSSFLQRLLWNTTVSVGVNNAFDRQPPTVLGAFNDNYDTSLYSIRNRYYYVSLNKKF